MHNKNTWLVNMSCLLIGMIPTSVDAQVVQPIPTTTIEQTKDAVEAFSMGMGVGVANYMCFEALKGNLDRATGNEILSLYQQWFNQQNAYKIEPFIKGFNLETGQFNRAFPSNRCPYFLR